MKAKLEGWEVEGTPDELIQILRHLKKVPVVAPTIAPISAPAPVIPMPNPVNTVQTINGIVPIEGRTHVKHGKVQKIHMSYLRVFKKNGKSVIKPRLARGQSVPMIVEELAPIFQQYYPGLGVKSIRKRIKTYVFNFTAGMKTPAQDTPAQNAPAPQV